MQHQRIMKTQPEYRQCVFDPGKDFPSLQYLDSSTRVTIAVQVKIREIDLHSFNRLASEYLDLGYTPSTAKKKEKSFQNRKTAITHNPPPPPSSTYLHFSLLELHSAAFHKPFSSFNPKSILLLAFFCSAANADPQANTLELSFIYLQEIEGTKKEETPHSLRKEKQTWLKSLNGPKTKTQPLFPLAFTLFIASSFIFPSHVGPYE